MMTKNTLIVLFLSILCSSNCAFAKEDKHLKQCWTKQAKELSKDYLQCTYRENNDNLYHSFKPWEILHNTYSGTLWYGAKAFLSADTLKNKYFSKTQYNDSELLYLSYGSNNISEVSVQEYNRQAIEFARYSPILLIQYFYANGARSGNESNDKYAVYKLVIEKQIVKLFVNKNTELADKVCITSDHKLYGDVTDTIVYGAYTSANGTYYPRLVYVNKVNGKVKDTVNIITASVVSSVVPLLAKPADYKLKEETKTNPEISVERYSDHIHFVYLKHTNGTSMIVEFKDYLLVAEAPLNSQNGELIIDEARKIAPNKPIRYFVFDHYHPDYIGGIRAFIHKDARILCTPTDIPYIQYLASAKHSLNPDSLELQPHPLQTEVFENEKTIADATCEMKIYFIGGKSKHTNDYLIYYFPAEKMLFEGDLVRIPEKDTITKAGERQAALYNAIKELGLEVNTIVQSWPIANYGIKSKIAFSELEQSMKVN